MSAPVVMFVSFQALPGKAAELRARLEELTRLTRVEDGCIQYDLHTDADDETKLYFYEQWRDKAAHAAHDLSPHVVAFNRDKDQLLASLDFVHLNLLEL